MLLGGSGSAALAAPAHDGAGTAAYGSAAREAGASYERAAGAPAERRTPGARTWRPAGATAGPSVEEHPCPVAVPSGTTCGYLLVPERRDVPNSRTIKVGYAVHHASGNGSGQAADPVVYMSGGPGSSSLQLTGLLTRMFPGRDVVALEQRGGRHSEPRLSCPEIVRGIVDTLRTPGPATGETAPVVRQALVCQSRLEDEHVDLRGYRTAEIAADVVDLRAALGYPRWNLFGVGYSTRPMLLAAARDPEGTSGVVLDSLLPPGARWYGESSAALSATMTKLGVAARFDAMVKALNAHPAAYDTRDPLTRGRVTVQLNGDDVATILGDALHRTDVISITPALVDGLAGGHTDLLQPLVDAAGDELTSHEWGLYYAIQCQDQAPYDSFAGSRGPRLFTGVVDAAVCNALKLPAARAETGLLSAAAPAGGASADGTSLAGTAASAGAGAAQQPPILVLGGAYDPSTPPEAARRAVSGVPGARFAEFAGVGHAVFLSSDCGRRTIAAFLDDPAATTPACDPGAAPHPMVRPGGLALTSAVYRMTQTPIPLAVPAVFLLVSAVQLLAGLICLLRRRGNGLSALAGLAGVALGALSALSLSGVEDRAMLVIGVPHALAWYGLLALVSTGLSVVEAFRLNAAAVRIVPALTGLAFLAWLYGWLLA